MKRRRSKRGLSRGPSRLVARARLGQRGAKKRSPVRSREQFKSEIAKDPRLAKFFESYTKRLARERERRERQLITEVSRLKETQETLRQSEEHFRLLMEGVADSAIFLLDPSGRIVSWNSGAERIYGWQAHEIFGHHASRFYVPEDYRYGTLDEELELAVAVGQLRQEGWRVRKDGSRFWTESVTMALRDEAGNLCGFASVTRDVTERRQAEERFRLVVELAPNAMVLVSKEGKINLVNSQTERLFGYSREELLGQTVEILVPERFRNKHPGYRRDFFGDPRARAMGEGRDLYGLRKDRTEVPVEIGLSPIETPQGPMVLAAIIDITERKRAESERSALLARELRAHLASEAAARRFAFLADAGHVLAASLDYRATLASLAQLAIPEIADWCFVDMFEGGSLHRLAVSHADPAKGELAELLKMRHLLNPDALSGPPNVLRTGQPELVPEVSDDLLARIARDPESLEILRRIGLRSYMCVPLQERGQILGIITFASAESGRRYTHEDLTLAKGLANRASLAVDNARLYRSAEEAISARDEFLSMASHELKTPIATLQIQLDGLLHGAEEGSGAPLSEGPRGTQLAILERQVKRLDKLVNNLLDLSRITGGRLDLELEDVDLSAVVRAVVLRFKEELKKSGSSVHIREGSRSVGLWDPMRLDQIVTNLLSNAIKYGAGKPIDITVDGSGSTAYLSVKDQGIGIDPEQQRHIFERFERAASARRYGGFGLGLWIVRRIVEALGGTISVTSQLGQGSTFTIELPRTQTKTVDSARVRQ